MRLPGILLPLFAASLLLALGACERTPHYTYQPQDFVGHWELTTESLASLQKRIGRLPKECSFDLKPDGSVTAVDLPVYGGSPQKSYYLSGRGSWKYNPPSKISAGTIDILVENSGGGFLVNDEAPIPVIEDAIPDPDSSERWVWKKSPSPR